MLKSEVVGSCDNLMILFFVEEISEVFPKLQYCFLFSSGIRVLPLIDPGSTFGILTLFKPFWLVF